MGTESNINLKPIVSKIFCSPSQAMLIIRKRPRLVNGGGFAVLNSHQNVVFSVEGCGILGGKGKLILKDGDGASILFIQKKEGIVQALSFYDRWRGYHMESGRPNKNNSVFSLKDPRSCFVMNNAARISVKPKSYNKDWDFEINGSFLDKACIINDSQGNIVAKVERRVAKVRVNEMNADGDLYYVAVQPGYDQAFVVGVIAILDNIHGESTSC